MPKLITDLPADVVQHILVRMTLAHHIGRAAPTCKVVSVAARNARKVRKFSSEVVTLGGDEDRVHCLAVAPNGRIVTGSHDGYVKVWCDGACEHTFDKFGDDAHIDEMTGDAPVNAVAVLPGGARFVSASNDETAKLWTLEGGFERTFEAGCEVRCVAALPDGAHFVVGLGFGFDEDEDEQHEDSYSLKLYHVDGTLVHAFKGHTESAWAVAVTPDGQHIISGSRDHLVMVWSVATKSLVSICHGHTNDVLAVAAIPDGRILSSGAYPDIAIRVWHLRGISSTAVPFASHLENEFKLHDDDEVKALVALPDNQHALSGSFMIIKLFNVNDGAVMRTLSHHTHWVRHLALLPDGRRFVSCSGDNARIVQHGLAL